MSNALLEIYVKCINECATFRQRLGNRKFRSSLKAFYKRYLNVFKTTFIYLHCSNVLQTFIYDVHIKRKYALKLTFYKRCLPSGYVPRVFNNAERPYM